MYVQLQPSGFALAAGRIVLRLAWAMMIVIPIARSLTYSARVLGLWPPARAGGPLEIPVSSRVCGTGRGTGITILMP